MDLDVVAFDDRFAEPAAALLSAAHTPPAHTPPARTPTVGASAVEVPPAVDLADPDAARDQLRAWRAAGPAVAAVHGDGALAGFMVATVAHTPGSPLARVRMPHHAVAQDRARAVYRRLYQELSRRLVGSGCFEHTVAVAAAHAETVTCLVELGFGFDQVKGLRPLTPPDGAGRRAGLRPARADDFGHLIDLVLELQRFHAAAPVLRPALIDLHVVKDDLHAAITDERRLALVAEVDGRVAGLMVADTDSRFRAAASIGIAVVGANDRAAGVGTALLSGVVDWATARGFGACAAEWSSANLVGDAFWRGHGFVPARYTLTRRIDPSVAWTDSRLDYGHFLPRERLGLVR